MPRSIWLLLLFVFLATLQYTVAPIIVRFKNGTAAEPTFDEIPDAHARVLFPQNFFATINEFERMGFSLVCHLSSASMVKNVHSMISLLVNRETKTMAAVGFIRSLAATGVAAVGYIEFHADFEDGTQLDTTNSDTVKIFYEVPGKRQVKVPHLKDPNAVYHVHLYMMKQNQAAPVLPPPGAEKDHFVNSVRQSLADQAEMGLYFLDENRKRYRFTWRGAYRATYRLVWPMKQIHQRRHEEAGRRIAREALGSFSR